MNKTLQNYEILMGVTGGIAAYKTAFLCSRLVQLGAGVTVAMTEHARQFVGELTFSTLTGRKVYTDLFYTPEVYDAQHINLTDRADLIVLAPATANILAKMAYGLCDDLLSTLLCSAASPLLIAPAMNCRMWENPATKTNIQLLRSRKNCHVIGPGSGRLACGTEGEGRMSEPEEILQKVQQILGNIPPKALARVVP